MQTQRVYHLCCYAATRKLICFGPPTDKEETFVLLDERVAKPKILTHDEQLATLARMYIRSHGPATVDDLARWTGL
ncbi:winged helix DNA-binding domain-containing protein [Patescibacteria group bacterium]|nr:winged helix DNA-binding domain-containing protein [Patescibacteria group bacterium]